MYARLHGKQYSGQQGAYFEPEMTVNAPEAVEYLRRPQIGKWLVRLSGIPVMRGTSPAPGWHTYQVALYQDHVLAIEKRAANPQWLHHQWEKDTSTSELIPCSLEDPEVQMVKKLAARSLYAAGIDIGRVTILAASAHRARVVRILPDWPAEKTDVYMKAARAWWETRVRLHPQMLAKLGADPEFALRKPNGEMALASDYVKVNGTVGCDTTRYREELAMHQHPVAELRPAATEDPDELFFRIWEALRLAGKKITDSSVEWLAGGMPFEGYPIGGHIHFSGITPTFALRRKLDAYLALPLVLIEDAGCRERRKRYGFLGDVREKEYGFEYRTLPSWLVHPDVTRGLFHLARLVAANHGRLQAAPHLQLPHIKAYYSGEREVLVPYVRQIRDELSQLQGYRLSQVHLDRYFSYLLSGNSWPASEDLRRAWKLI